MHDESHIEKIARIDQNVQTLIKLAPLIYKLDKDSAINKREHKFAAWFAGLLLTPLAVWICKKLGIPIF